MSIRLCLIVATAMLCSCELDRIPAADAADSTADVILGVEVQSDQEGEAIGVSPTEVIEDEQVLQEQLACIDVNPSMVSFGGKSVGEKVMVPVELSSCGEIPLEVYGISVAAGSSANYSIDLTDLEITPTADSPLVIGPGSSVAFHAIFAPSEDNPIDSEGHLILDIGSIRILSNAPSGETEVNLSGAGTCLCSGTAIIECVEGDEVPPQTTLHFFGDKSIGVQGTEIVKWEWSVEQPNGSMSVFVPSLSYPNPTFEVNVAGVYTFNLVVWDSTGQPSAFPAAYQVVVIPCEALHIELLWHNPEDPDETDIGPEAGSDLDLHFLHPWAAGPDVDKDGEPDGFFDIPWNCFWFNAHPNWGSFDPGINDDPGLDRDDTDGAGPENINLDIPENVVYRVGVHYWNDHGFGPAYATVRVYIYGQLVFEVSEVQLVVSDMWEVCTIEWPSGKTSPVTTAVGYKIIPGYHNPFFGQ
jgi:hypothetical protein